MSAAAELTPADPGVLSRLRAYTLVVQTASDPLTALDTHDRATGGRRRRPTGSTRRLGQVVRAAHQASAPYQEVTPR